jgi:hypothetical protein
MRLLIALTFVVAAWVCFVGATFSSYALLAALGFGAAASFCLWVAPRTSGDR